MKKRLFSLLVVVMLVFGMASMVFAAEASTISLIPETSRACKCCGATYTNLITGCPNGCGPALDNKLFCKVHCTCCRAAYVDGICPNGCTATPVMVDGRIYCTLHAPGTTDPTDPGTTDPTDPGTTDPTDPGTTDPGTTDPTDPGTTDPTNPDKPSDNPKTDNPKTGDSAMAMLIFSTLAGAVTVLKKRA